MQWQQDAKSTRDEIKSDWPGTATCTKLFSEASFLNLLAIDWDSRRAHKSEAKAIAQSFKKLASGHLCQDHDLRYDATKFKTRNLGRMLKPPLLIPRVYTFLVL